MKPALELLRRIDAVCEQFEASLRTSTPQTIEAASSGWHGEDRRQLFIELLSLEVDVLHRDPSSIDAEDYLVRFPQFDREVTTVLTAARGSRSSERVGDYTLLREVGRGAMGKVYEARRESLGMTVALKVLRPIARAQPGAMARFTREARVTAQLEHPNIVKVFDVGHVGETMYFAMQLIRGVSLDWLSHPDPVPDSCVGFRALRAVCPREYAERVARIGIAGAAALEHAHASGVIHRDVKPSNCILDDAGKLWVIDFGLAKIAQSNLTLSTDVLGSLRYMAPERFLGRCTNQSDIYGLGMVLYELLALRPAFVTRDRARLVEEIKQARPRRLHDIWQAIPDELASIVHRAIDVEALRFANAVDLQSALQSFVEGVSRP